MGYYTWHELEISADGEEEVKIIAELRNSCEDAHYALNENGSGQESCKWYDHQNHMKAFSLIYPHILFALHGEGEESGDIWVEYFKNGKSRREEAVIAFADFDETKLT